MIHFKSTWNINKLLKLNLWQHEILYELLAIFLKYKNHLVRLNTAIPTQAKATKGLNLSPITAALLIIPLNPLRCDSMKLGLMALMYEAVHMMRRATIIMLSKLKKALYHYPNILPLMRVKHLILYTYWGNKYYYKSITKGMRLLIIA